MYGQYLQPGSNEEDETLAVMMKYLAERLKQLGSCFVFVITPSKATLFPEDIPDRYLIKLKQEGQRPTNYKILVPKLKKYEVPYVDGLQITLEHKGTLPERVFPKTGAHWTRAVAFFTVADLLKTIEHESGRKMPPLTESIENIDQRPDTTDADLFNLLNIIQEPNQRYLHPRFQVPRDKQGKAGILTSVGGSFTETILDVLASAQVFERMNHYSYFRVYKLRYPNRSASSVDEHAIPWEEDFWNTTAVVLEANEEALAGLPSRSIDGFLMAALAELEQKIPRKRSANDASPPLVWGFGVHQNGIALPKTGFSIPEPGFTLISGQEAGVDLPSPGENRDLQLIFEAKPFLRDDVPKRFANVAVNGIPVGTLELVNSDFQFYSLTIKAAVNRSSILKLHLSFSPVAPGAARSLEIALARLALVPIEVPVSRQTVIVSKRE